MSIERLTLKQPFSFQGVNDLEELKRALIINWDTLANELRAKVVADSSVLPAQVSGNSNASTASVATTDDIDRTLVLGLMLQG